MLYFRSSAPPLEPLLPITVDLDNIESSDSCWVSDDWPVDPQLLCTKILDYGESVIDWIPLKCAPCASVFIGESVRLLDFANESLRRNLGMPR